jgi:RimJ/RimL family protein N-acetyltransferase
LDYRHGHRRHFAGHGHRFHGALMRLIQVDPVNETHVRFLYELFLARPEDAKISAKGIPAYEDHRHFVENHPYADWSLVELQDPPLAGDETGWHAANDGVVIGAVFISQPARPSVVGDELSVDIMPEFRGRGYAEEALRLMMERHAPRRFVANVAPENYASMALFKKLGFKLCQVTFERVDG